MRRAALMSGAGSDGGGGGGADGGGGAAASASAGAGGGGDAGGAARGSDGSARGSAGLGDGDVHVTLTNRPLSAKNRIIVGSGFSHTNTSTSRNNVQRMADRLSDGSHRVIVYDVFAFEGHTLADIAARLAATSVLVTPAGAGVFNSIFLKRGSAVVVVFQVGAHQCFTHQVSTYVVRTRVRSDRGIHHCKQYAVCLFLRRRTALQYTFMNNYNYLSSKISSNHQQQQQYPQFLRWVADLGVYAIPCAPKSPA